MNNITRNENKAACSKKFFNEKSDALSEYFQLLKKIDGDIDDMIFYGEDPKYSSEK